MNVNITEEQIMQLAAKRINELVDVRVKEVLNSEYWQTMSQRIDKAVKQVVTEKVTESRIEKALNKLDTQASISDMSSKIAETIVGSIVSE